MLVPVSADSIIGSLLNHPTWDSDSRLQMAFSRPLFRAQNAMKRSRPESLQWQFQFSVAGFNLSKAPLSTFIEIVGITIIGN